MARKPQSLRVSNSIEYTVSAPADARLVVETKSDLTDSGSFPYPYKGMPVAVQDEGSLYLFIGDDPTDDASWRKIGEDGSVELTQAEYDALSDAEKNNGVVYYVTDGVVPNHGFSTMRLEMEDGNGVKHVYEIIGREVSP